MTQVVVAGGSVLDVAAGRWQPVDVRIDGNRIVEVGPGLPAGSARIIDASGRYVIPGLIDAHVHVTAFSADFRELERNSASYVYAQTSAIMRGMLARGFTTVRDMAGADHGLARAQEEGLLPGPRLYFCGHAISQ